MQAIAKQQNVKPSLELIAPAGNMLKLNTAFRYGADAVYLGGKTFNLRAASDNFNKEELVNAIQVAHGLGKKVYVTLNIIAHERELKALPQFIRFLHDAKADAVIVADLGVADLVSENSDLPIHVSTQSSTANSRSVRVWQKLGAKRIVLARETSLSEIKQIKDAAPDMELEVFIHGSMCMTYSGRCQLSSYMATRDGNRGACANTCRWKYYLVEERRPGEYYPVYEDDQGSHIYNSKDLRTVEFLDQIIDAGVTGFKIEGRMKSILYNAVTTKVYREAMDLYLSGEPFQVRQSWLDELSSYSHRGYTNGFFFGKPDQDSTKLDGGHLQTKELVGFVKEKVDDDAYLVQVFNKITTGSELEVIPVHGTPSRYPLTDFYEPTTGALLNEAQANRTVRLRLSPQVEVGDVVRQGVIH